jgi:pimeloyl-ACP methyl ester carboxylesterase
MAVGINRFLARHQGTLMLSRLNIIAGITLALMIPHAASAQTSRERASLNGFEHRDIALDDGVRIHYLIGGAGPPVVLLHGYPETWYAWRKVMPQLAARYTVIAPDLRGFGDSSRPAGGYDRKTMAGDIRDLARRLGYDRVLLAGHDWGGSTAVAYAVAWPAEVRRLVVIEAQPRGPWSERDPGFREPWFYGFHRIPGFAETIVAGHERQYLTWFYRAFALAPDAIAEAEIDEYMRSYGAPDGMRPGFELVRALPVDVENNRVAMARRVDLPVLAVGGDHSLGTRVAENLGHLASNVQSVVVENCAHFVPEEQPARTAELILRFFAETP